MRRFKPEPVSPDVLNRLLEAAAWAPSAGNRQDWRFAVVTSDDVRRRMASAAEREWDAILAAHGSDGVVEELARYRSNFGWFAEAPVVIAVSCKVPEGFLVHYLGALADDVAGTQVSAAMAAQNLMLAAHANGLGSCCLTAPLVAEQELKRILGLGRRSRIACLIAVGYADESPAAPARKPLDDIVRFLT